MGAQSTERTALGAQQPQPTDKHLYTTNLDTSAICARTPSHTCNDLSGDTVYFLG